MVINDLVELAHSENIRRVFSNYRHIKMKVIVERNVAAEDLRRSLTAVLDDSHSIPPHLWLAISQLSLISGIMGAGSVW